MLPKGASSTEHVAGLLSEYIDGRLSVQERHRLEAHLAACPQCQDELASLQATVTMLRALPPVPLPRNFYVYREQVKARPPLWNLGAILWPRPALRLATVLVSFLFILVLSGDVLSHTLLPRAAAPAPAALDKGPPAPATPATPSLAIATPVPQQRVLEAIPPATPSPVPLVAPPPSAPEEPSPETVAPLARPTPWGAPPSPGLTSAQAGPLLWRAAEVLLGLLAAALFWLTWRARGP